MEPEHPPSSTGSFCAPESCEPPEPEIFWEGDMMLALGFIALMLVVLARFDKWRKY